MTDTGTLLSLERARFELRVPEEDTSQDVLLTGLIASAISSLTGDVNVPLLDINVETIVHLSGRSGIQVYDPYLKSITSISYQPTSENSFYGYFPNKVIANRCTITPGGQKGAFVIRPRGNQSWPDAAYNRFRIEGIAGLADDDPALAAYRSATVLLFRSLYDGVPILREDSAYERIIRPLGRKDLSSFSRIGLVAVSTQMHTNYVGTTDDVLSDVTSADFTVSGATEALFIPRYPDTRRLLFARPVSVLDPSEIYLYRADGRNTVNQINIFVKSGIALQLGGVACNWWGTVDLQKGFGGYALEQVN